MAGNRGQSLCWGQCHAPGSAGRALSAPRGSVLMSGSGALQSTDSELPDDAVLLACAFLRMLDRMCTAAVPKQALPLSFWRRFGTDEAGAVFSSPVTDLHSIISLL